MVAIDRSIKDRRDAVRRVAPSSGGDVVQVCPPASGSSLVRAHLDAVHALRRARQQLSGFLLRQGCHYL